MYKIDNYYYQTKIPRFFYITEEQEKIEQKLQICIMSVYNNAMGPGGLCGIQGALIRKLHIALGAL